MVLHHLRRLGDHSHLLNRALAFTHSAALAPPTRTSQQTERWRDRYRRLVEPTATPSA